MPQHWAGPALSQVCTGTCVPVMVVSNMELASLLPYCVQGHTSWWWLPLSTQGHGLGWLCSLPVCTILLAIAGSPFLGSSARARVAGVVAQCGLWCMLGGLGKLARAPGSFQSAASMLWPEINKSVCALFKSRVLLSYSPLVNPIGFQTS